MIRDGPGEVFLVDVHRVILLHELLDSPIIPAIDLMYSSSFSTFLR